MRRSRSPLCALLAIVIIAVLGKAALANCIAHQPRNMVFTPPDLPLQWNCITAGPLYEHERNWYLVTFKVTNQGQRRTAAFKMQANVVDAFGDILLSVPIVENANLGNGDSDGAVWALHPPFSYQSVDHVVFHVLAVKFADGTLWNNPKEVKSGTLPSAHARLQRFAMTGMNYDMGSVIAPSPSPTPSRF